MTFLRAQNLCSSPTGCAVKGCLFQAARLRRVLEYDAVVVLAAEFGGAVEVAFAIHDHRAVWQIAVGAILLRAELVKQSLFAAGINFVDAANAAAHTGCCPIENAMFQVECDAANRLLPIGAIEEKYILALILRI